LTRLWLKTMPGALKASVPFGDLLRSAGIDPATTLRWALLSHSHLDHAGGLMDLPGVPILMAQEEIDFIRGTGFKATQQIVPAIARMLDARAQPLHFEAKRYEICLGLVSTSRSAKGACPAGRAGGAARAGGKGVLVRPASSFARRGARSPLRYPG
jgi:hypothetical protein